MTELAEVELVGAREDQPPGANARNNHQLFLAQLVSGPVSSGLFGDRLLADNAIITGAAFHSAP